MKGAMEAAMAVVYVQRLCVLSRARAHACMSLFCSFPSPCHRRIVNLAAVWLRAWSLNASCTQGMVTEAAEMKEDPHIWPLRTWTRTEICAFQKPRRDVHAALKTVRKIAIYASHS